MQINEHYSRLVADMDSILNNEIELINGQVEILNIKREGAGINAPFFNHISGQLEAYNFCATSMAILKNKLIDNCRSYLNACNGQEYDTIGFIPDEDGEPMTFSDEDEQ